MIKFAKYIKEIITSLVSRFWRLLSSMQNTFLSCRNHATCFASEISRVLRDSLRLMCSAPVLVSTFVTCRILSLTSLVTGVDSNHTDLDTSFIPRPHVSPPVDFIEPINVCSMNKSAAIPHHIFSLPRMTCKQSLVNSLHKSGFWICNSLIFCRKAHSDFKYRCCPDAAKNGSMAVTALICVSQSPKSLGLNVRSV